MPIDPNIALSVRVAPFQTRIQSPVDRYARMLSLRQLMQQQETSQALEEERRQKAQLAREEQERQAQFRGLFKAGQPAPTREQAYGILGPTAGATYAEGLRKEETAQQATETTRLANEKARSANLGQIAGAILQANTQEGFERGVMDAMARDVISQEEGHQLIGMPWNEQTRAQVQQIYRRGIDAKEQQAMDIAAAEEGRAAALGKPALAKAETESLQGQLQLAAQTVPDNQTDWDTWRAALPAELQSRVPAMYSPTARELVQRLGLTPAQRVTSEQTAATAAETARHHRESERLLGKGITARAAGTPGTTADDPKLIADAIIAGRQNPDLKGLYRYSVPVRAELERRGYNQAVAQRDWNAVQKHLSTLNSQQQERLRQAVTFTYDSLDQIEDLFDRWKTAGKVSGMPLLNRANIAVAKQLPGEHGAIAQALEAQINDLTSELGTVYKGGNASTDESLRLAAENLKAHWNENQFKEQLGNIRKNLQIRKNSILSSEPVGVTPGSPYLPPVPAGGSTTTRVPDIEVNGKRYRYNGSGARDDLSNWTEIKKEKK